VKLVFLIADAPPHLDYQGGSDYAASVLALDDLVVRLVSDELRPLSAGGQ
jgi:hypothetical protein